MLKPTGHNLIVTEELEKLSETIHVPEGSQKRNQLCTVVAVGPKVEDVRPGDRVLAAIYGGIVFEHEGQTVRQLNTNDLLAKVIV